MPSYPWPKSLVALSLVAVLLRPGDSVAFHRAGLTPPAQVLWAWERSEDLRFLSPHTGVAVLVSTIQLRRGAITERPRMNSLLVAPGVRLLTVVRIEADGAIPAASIPTIGDLIISRAALPQVEGLQIDFDAKRSQRSSYENLLRELRRRLAPSQSLSITALASWCEGDDWLSDLPIDYAVPMLFRLGAERSEFRDAATTGHAFREPLCRSAVGLSTDEPLSVPQSNSVFWFSPTPWSTAQYLKIGQRK